MAVGQAGIWLALANLLALGLSRGSFAGYWVALAGLWLLRSLVLYAQLALASSYAAELRVKLRADLSTYYDWQGESGAESWLQLDSGTSAILPLIERFFPLAAQALVMPVVLVLAIAVVDPVSALVVILTLPFIPLLIVLIGQWAARTYGQAIESRDRLAVHYAELVRAALSIKALGLENLVQQRFSQQSRAESQNTQAVLRVGLLQGLVLELISGLAIALVAVGVALRVSQASLAWLAGFYVLFLVPELYRSWRELAGAYHDFKAAADLTPALNQVRVQAPAGLPLTQSTALLELDKVSFQYPEAVERVLSDFSLRVEPGCPVALYGPSGGGKSTVLRLLLGLLTPNAGQVRGFGQNLAGLELSAYWAKTGYLAQEPHLFPGSLQENLTMGRPADSDTIWAALELAAAEAIVSRLPAGLATRVGPGGKGVSGGELRRLALARALLFKPPILILDEPSANLDAASEARILANLTLLVPDRSVVIATHRPVAVAWAAQRVEL